ncbi:MAG: hypothetical protein K2K48_06175 [Anaeroplasmataceae bacterium]|nr:hypothetical protein [Anaeroplasmataceae bacterium]MDE6414983.1 hypothetical protein [Anaeroplasmataceae bacterium]
MRINNQTCTRCVNDKTIKHIHFDKKGVCNFCNSYDKLSSVLENQDYLDRLFQSKIKDHSHTYDVALGFSGGKDSTYVLYQLVHKYKLKVITYTLDNGFLSDEAKKKIDKLVKELGVPHEYVACDMELLKEMYKVMVEKYLSPCIACSFLGYAVMLNYATKVDAAIGIHGRSRAQMFRNYAEDVDDVFKPFIEEGLKEIPKPMNELVYTILDKIERLVHPSLAKMIKENLLKEGLEQGFREFVSFFIYHTYDKDEILQTLIQNTSWRVESEEEHFDCLIHHGALYLKDQIARRSHLMPEYSYLIRNGQMTKEEALKALAYVHNKKQAKLELKGLCQYAKISYPKVMLKAFIYKRRWW